MNAYDVAFAQVFGRALPPVPAIPGRAHRMHDEPLPDEYMQGLTCPLELAALRRVNKFIEAEHLQASACTTT